MESNNLWLYSDNHEQYKVANSMLSFGAEQFMSSKLVSEIDKLTDVMAEFGSGSIPVHVQKEVIMPFAFSYLIDTIKIILFFENYMKSELLIKGFLIHKIIGKDEFKPLQKQQEKRPVKLIELNEIECFTVNESDKHISHRGVAAVTLGFNQLIRRDAYCQHYKFDDNVRKILVRLNENRNKLHLYESIDFTLSTSFIGDIKHLIDFVRSVTSPK
ncbi:hypothetical protein I0P70_07140 [Pontibacter sp. FD36]|uniref:hypothetical protein n=1 Tax=Pontibacter sp. FD36 TaxID=2789860 RepID=UPI0018ABFA1E|nr:hypothetical protein [Pontibacter sp. FD36]MBF8963013.1 hypothetical protein [Pontibacter sp. FD36]